MAKVGRKRVYINDAARKRAAEDRMYQRNHQNALAAQAFNGLMVAIREAARTGKLPVELSLIEDETLLCWEFQSWANGVDEMEPESATLSFHNARTGTVEM
jgi:hypothetical protein